MEKFTNWRDKATGISPFNPVGERYSWVSLSYRIPIAVLKFPFFILLVFAILITAPIKPLQRLAIRLYLFLICGVYSIPPLKASTLGSIICVNFSSFLDPLIVSCVDNNAIFLTNDIHQTRVLVVTKWQLLKRAISVPDAKFDSQCQVLTQWDQIPKGKTAWYFVESTTSNNKAILKFEIPKIGPNVEFSTLTMMKSTWAVSVLPASILNIIWLQLANATSLKLGFKSDKLIPAKDIRSALCAGSKLRPVNLGVKDKISFLEAYDKRNKY